MATEEQTSEEQTSQELLQQVLAQESPPVVWDALGQWAAYWQGAIAQDGPPGAELAGEDRQLVSHLGDLDWQGVPPERLSRSRSLTVEMHRQLMLLQTDLRFLSVARQAQKRSQLMKQVGDRLTHISGYCEMARQYFNGSLDE